MRHSLYENREAGLATTPGDIMQCSCGATVRRDSEGRKYEFSPAFTAWVRPREHVCRQAGVARGPIVNPWSRQSE